MTFNKLFKTTNKYNHFNLTITKHGIKKNRRLNYINNLNLKRT